MTKIALSVILIFVASYSYGQEDNSPIFSPKLGVCTSVSNHKIVAAAGYDYIEESVGKFLVPEKPEADFLINLAVLKESSIPVLACNGFIPGSLKTTGPNPQHEEILDFAEIAFRRAKEAGIKKIVFGSSGSRNFPESFDKSDATKQFIELLLRMGPIAAKYDVIVVIEPLREKESNLVNRVEEAYPIALEVNHPNIQVLGDIYHMLCENELPESLFEARTILGHMHIAEKENRNAPGLSGENFVPYLNALKKAGYNQGISIEGNWGHKDDFEKNLIISRAYLQGQINTLN